MFERGRKLGKLENETKWQIKDAGRRTREAVQSAAARLQKERDENWSELGSKELLNRLLERKVLRMEEGRIKDATIEEAFGDLCRQFLNSDVNNKEVEISESDSVVKDNIKEKSDGADDNAKGEAGNEHNSIAKNP